MLFQNNVVWVYTRIIYNFALLRQQAMITAWSLWDGTHSIDLCCQLTLNGLILEIMILEIMLIIPQHYGKTPANVIVVYCSSSNRLKALFPSHSL